MSTLNVSNITDGTTTVGTSYVVNGAAKACGMIDMPPDFGSANAIYASINVSSVTDDSTGNTTVALSSSFSSNTSKCVTTGAVLSNKLTAYATTSSSASNIKLQTTDADSDSEQDQVQIFSASGDLA